MWVAECLKNKTLVCVSDNSYNKQVAPDVCSAGWVMTCILKKSRALSLNGLPMQTVTEENSQAYWQYPIEEYHNTISEGNEVCCDNKGALYTFDKKYK